MRAAKQQYQNLDELIIKIDQDTQIEDNFDYGNQANSFSQDEMDDEVDICTERNEYVEELDSWNEKSQLKI